MLAEFLIHYEANIAAESRPFPGAVAALERLAARGRDARGLHQQARKPVAAGCCKSLSSTRYFAAIAGRDTFPVSKPDPGHLTGTIALAGGDPSRAVMIGDSEIDLAHGEGRRRCRLSWSASAMRQPRSTERRRRR